MRLLDQIAQCSRPLLVRQDGGELHRVTSAADFGATIRKCPLRYVLDDDLVRGCTALAHAQGDELSGCLDLVHIPAPLMWVEWSERARREQLAQIPCWSDASSTVLQAGVLICGGQGSRHGSMRTFWVTRQAPEEPLVASVETLLDLDAANGGSPAESLLEAETVGIGTSANAHVNRLLQCARFRLDPLWKAYYHAVSTPEDTQAIVRQSLAAVASDVPMLLGFFLLLGARASLVERPILLARLNRKRARLGKQALLEHVEIASPLFSGPDAWTNNEGEPGGRRSPRFHHVRGHLVRRKSTLYWRAPHWRGHVRLGSVRSRTVELRASRQ